MAVYCALSDHRNLHDSSCWRLPSLDRVPVVVYVWFVHVIPMIRASPSSVISCVSSTFVFLANGELLWDTQFHRNVQCHVSIHRMPDSYVWFWFGSVLLMVMMIVVVLFACIEGWSPFQVFFFCFCFVDLVLIPKLTTPMKKKRQMLNVNIEAVFKLDIQTYLQGRRSV